MSVEVFLGLSGLFFPNNESISFTLADKRQTQDDPLDCFIADAMGRSLDGILCTRAQGALISPDMVFTQQWDAAGPLTDAQHIIAVEVKKVGRTRTGRVSRLSGIDFNSTPPSATSLLYTASGRKVWARGYYLFLCVEPTGVARTHKATALCMCDGSVLNSDMDLYRSAIGRRTKRIGLGTYKDGIDRLRPMFVFPNPLGAAQFDHACTLISRRRLISRRLAHTADIVRTVEGETTRDVFHVYRVANGANQPAQIPVLENPFPKPSRRSEQTQARGKFMLRT